MRFALFSGERERERAPATQALSAPPLIVTLVDTCTLLCAADAVALTRYSRCESIIQGYYLMRGIDFLLSGKKKEKKKTENKQVEMMDYAH